MSSAFFARDIPSSCSYVSTDLHWVDVCNLNKH